MYVNFDVPYRSGNDNRRIHFGGMLQIWPIINYGNENGRKTKSKGKLAISYESVGDINNCLKN